MAITAKEVAALRSKTGAGMMDCKKALTEAEGNEEKAIELLRQKGIEAAGKKVGRETSEGRVHSYIHHNFKVGAMIKLSCETDSTLLKKAWLSSLSRSKRKPGGLLEAQTLSVVVLCS